MTTNELYAQMGVSQKVLDFGATILEEITPNSPTLMPWRSTIRPR